MLALHALSCLPNWKRRWHKALCAYGNLMRIVWRNRGLSARSYYRRRWAGCWCTWRITRSGTWDRRSRRRRLLRRNAGDVGTTNERTTYRGLRVAEKLKGRALVELAPFRFCLRLFSFERRSVGRSCLAHFFFLLRREMQRLRFLKLRG